MCCTKWYFSRNRFSARSNATRNPSSVAFAFSWFTVRSDNIDFIIINAVIDVFDVDQIEDFICCKSLPYPDGSPLW